MSKWNSVKLGEIGKIVTGNTPSTNNIEYYSNNDIAFYKPNDLSETKVTYLDDATNYVSELAKTKLRMLPKGSVLVTCIGTIGKVGVTLNESSCNQQINAIIPDFKKIDSQYLAYCIFSKKKQIQSFANAAIVPIINKTNFSNIEILLPPLETQKQIAKTLDTAAELLAMRKKQQVELEILIKSIFYDMFGDPVANEKRWSTGIIKDLARKIQYGTSEKASTEKLQFPVLRMNNLTYQGNMDFTDLKYIELSDKDQKKFLVQEGEMLFNRTNSKELVGKTAVFKEKVPMAYAGYLIRLVPNERANADFISTYLNSSYGKKLLFKMAKNIVGMANINAQELGNIAIYIPPIELQNQFATIVTKIEEQKSIVKKAIDETQYLFDSLMSEYFE